MKNGQRRTCWLRDDSRPDAREGAFAAMVKMHLELEGKADDVVRTLRRIWGVAPDVGQGHADAQIAPADHNQSEPAAVLESETTASAGALPPARWTEELAADFMAGLDPMARRMAQHVWRAGAAGIHRGALCRRMELTPVELRSLLVRMSHVLRRFQRERGLTLPRPVAANSTLQSYFVDPDFAAVAASDMFGESTADQLA